MLKNFQISHGSRELFRGEPERGRERGNPNGFPRSLWEGVYSGVIRRICIQIEDRVQEGFPGEVHGHVGDIPPLSVDLVHQGLDVQGFVQIPDLLIAQLRADGGGAGGKMGKRSL